MAESVGSSCFVRRYSEAEAHREFENTVPLPPPWAERLKRRPVAAASPHVPLALIPIKADERGERA